MLSVPCAFDELSPVPGLDELVIDVDGFLDLLPGDAAVLARDALGHGLHELGDLEVFVLSREGDLLRVQAGFFDGELRADGLENELHGALDAGFPLQYDVCEGFALS